MKKYYWLGSLLTFIVIFNLGYVFHEVIMFDFFKEKIGAIQRKTYIIPLIALAAPDAFCYLEYMLLVAGDISDLQL